MTNPIRGGLVVLGGFLASLMLGASVVSPSPAAAVTVAHSSIHASHEVSAAPETDAAQPDATEPVPGTEIAIDDPARAQDAAVELSGEVVVSVSEVLSAEADAEATSEFGYSIETTSGQVVPISGDIPETISTGDQFVGTVAVEAVAEQVAPETAVELETSTQSGALPEAAEATQDAIGAAEATGTKLPVVQAQVTVAAAATAAAGQPHEIVIVANAPNGLSRPSQSDAQLRALAEKAAAHWQSSSNGQISRFSVNPYVTKLAGGSCDEDPFTTWNRAAAQLGYRDWAAFRSSTPGTSRHLVVMNPSACNESGVGVIGSGIHYGGAVRQSTGKGVDLSTLTHEIGHNLGLGHSDLQLCSGSSCTSHEYWDIYDVMGLGIVNYDVLTPLNTSTASRLGFLPSSATAAYALPSGSAAKSWTVELAPLRSASGVRHLAVTDPITKEVFHIELRSGLGNPSPYYALNPKRTLAGKSVTFAPGVRMLRAVKNGSAAVASAQPGGANLPAIVAGQSISSPSGGITVTAVSGSPATSMRVQVTLGSSTASTTSPDGSFPVYRFWSDAYQGHFYTISAAEKAQVQTKYPSHIWRYEAVAYRAFTSKQPGTIPLYRFWSNTMNGHFYTASEAEKNHVIAAYDDNVWKYETIAYWVYPASSATSATKPVYRFWSDTKRHHFYTASASERDHVIRSYDDRVWKYETAAYRVPSS